MARSKTSSFAMCGSKLSIRAGVEIDDAGEKVGGGVGNVIARSDFRA